MKISQKEGENALLQLPIYLNFQLVSKKNDSKAKKNLRNCPSSNARCPHRRAGVSPNSFAENFVRIKEESYSLHPYLFGLRASFFLTIMHTSYLSFFYTVKFFGD